MALRHIQGQGKDGDGAIAVIPHDGVVPLAMNGPAIFGEIAILYGGAGKAIAEQRAGMLADAIEIVRMDERPILPTSTEAFCSRPTEDGFSLRRPAANLPGIGVPFDDCQWGVFHVQVELAVGRR